MKIEINTTAKDEYAIKVITKAYHCINGEDAIKLALDLVLANTHGYEIVENGKVLCAHCKSSGYLEGGIECVKCLGVGRYRL